jgi:hypothetical protein
VTDNGGGRFDSPQGEYEPRQQDSGSWFTPSGHRSQTQSAYQDTNEDAAENDGAPGDDRDPATRRDEPGGAPFGGFPDTGGYPGLGGARPGLAEPYPDALSGLGGPPGPA